MLNAALDSTQPRTCINAIVLKHLTHVRCIDQLSGMVRHASLRLPYLDGVGGHVNCIRIQVLRRTGIMQGSSSFIV